MFDETRPQQRVDVRQLIGVHNAIAPRPIQIDEVETVTGIPFPDFGTAQ